MFSLSLFEPIGGDCWRLEDNFDTQLKKAFESFDRVVKEWPVRKLSTKTQLSLVTDVLYVDDDGNCIIEIVAPGYSKDDVEINTTEDLLTVKAKKKNENKRGLSLLGFEKSYRLDRKYDVDSVSAVHKDGVLTIKLQPREKTKQENLRRVEIK